MDHDFGKHLAKARTDRGLSLDQAAAAVRIRATFLRALEASDLTKFPNAAYAKSFLLMYGRFLGVDLKNTASQIDTTTQMKIEGYQYLTNRATEPRKGKAKPEPAPEYNTEPAPRASGSLLPLVVLGAVAVIALIVFVVWNNLNRLGDNPGAPPSAKTPNPVAAPVVEPVVQNPAPGQKAPPIVASPSAQNPAEPPRPRIISVPPQGDAPADGEIPRARPVSPVAKIAANDSDVLADLSPPKPKVLSLGGTSAPPPRNTATPDDEGSASAIDRDVTVLEPKRKSWVVIRTAPGGQVLFEDYLYPSAKPMRLPKGRYFIELRDADAVEITRSGQRVGYSKPGVLVE